LIPTVPLLGLSVIALGLFYAAPARFERILARLPGEDFLRMVLMFAPASLLSLVILAVLYAVEAPKAEPAALERTRPAARVAARGAMALPRWAPWALVAISTGALLFSVGAAALSLIAPGRFAALIAPLPGDRYLTPLVRVSPLPTVMLTALAVAYAFGVAGRAAGAVPWPRIDAARVSRIAAGLVLVQAVPMLAISLAALGLYFLSPGRFGRLIGQLAEQEWLRAGLLLAPVTLFTLLLMASLFFSGRPAAAAEGGRAPPAVETRDRQAAPEARPQPDPGWRGEWAPRLATWVLAVGLVFTAVTGTGLLGALFYLLLR
jgi:hypothetical protein